MYERFKFFDNALYKVAICSTDNVLYSNFYDVEETSRTSLEFKNQTKNLLFKQLFLWRRHYTSFGKLYKYANDTRNI